MRRGSRSTISSPQKIWGKFLALSTLGEEAGLSPLPLSLANANRPLPGQGGEAGLRPPLLPVRFITLFPALPQNEERGISIFIYLSLSFHISFVGSHVTFCFLFSSF